MMLLTIFSYFLISILGLLVLLLVLPVEYVLKGSKEEEGFLQFKLCWIFRLAGFQLDYDTDKGFRSSIILLGMTKEFKFKKDPESPKKPKEQDMSKWMDRNALKKFIGFMGKVFRHIKPEKFELAGRVGFENPYHTGLLSAAVHSVHIPGCSIKPVFDDQVIEGRLLIQGRMILAVLALMAIQLLLSGPVRNIVFKKRKENKSYVQFR